MEIDKFHFDRQFVGSQFRSSYYHVYKSTRVSSLITGVKINGKYGILDLTVDFFFIENYVLPQISLLLLLLLLLFFFLFVTYNTLEPVFPNLFCVMSHLTLSKILMPPM